MRICVVGTSNAIYKEGYAGALRDDPRVTAFSKFPLGASPSVIIPFFGSRIDFSEFDWVVFETTINDANYFKYGSIRKDQIRQFLEWGVARAAAAGCRSAMLVMPTRRGLKRHNTARTIYRRVAEETASVHLDGFGVLNAVAANLGADPAALFIDDFHVERAIARDIGRSLLDAIVSHDYAPLPKIGLKSDFYRIDLYELGDDRIVERSTSLATARFLALHDGRPVVVHANSGDELAGIAYNATKTTGAVRLGPDQQAVKTLRTKYAGNDKAMQLFVAPVIGAPRADANGKFTIQLALNDEAVTETSRFEHYPDHNLAHPVVEISSLIFRRSVR